MPSHADIIITNAAVYTVNPAHPHAEAVAVKGNRIVFVGSSTEAESWRGPQTRIIDGQGRTLLPGFIDSHFHLLHGSLDLAGVSLDKIKSMDKVAEAVEAWRAENPNAPWIVGHSGSYSLPAPGESLTRQRLDQIEAERPFVIWAFDGHTVWANTPALQKAGYLENPPSDLGNAEIVIGEDGLPNGELREPPAFKPLTDLIPQPDYAQTMSLLKKGLKLAASRGVTSIHNMDGDAEQATLYAALDDLGELSLRIYIPYSITPETPLTALEKEAILMRDTFNSDMLRGGCVKFFMDGVLESYTAMMLNGYPEQPHNHGVPIFPPEHFERMVIEADRLGLQIFTHACGDWGVRATLDGYEAAQTVNGKRDSRHRVEHIEVLNLEDLPRFADLGVIAAMQPLHAPLTPASADIWMSRITETDWDRSFPWRTLREAGAVLSFGSDWPVVSLNPLRGLHSACTRQPWGEGHADHRQTLAEAIDGYTASAAYAEFMEDKKGRLKVGMWADMVLLSENIFAIPAEALADVEVELTICNGRVVFERDKAM